MPLTFKVNAGSGDFKSVPSGSHIAVCNLVADLGMQPGSAAYPAPKQKVFIRFEIPAERVDYEKDGRRISGPAVIGAFFTASMHEKATLRNRLEGWRGRMFTDEEAGNFDVSTILGKPCMLNVVENSVGDKTYTNIASISPLPKGINAPVAENKLLYYAEDDKGDFDLLPDWIKEKIDKQLTRKPEPSHANYSHSDSVEITDDDIPF
jgi:hypothetical protein